MPHLRQTLAAFTFLAGLILAFAGPATARESTPGNDTCPTDLTALLSDVTMYGVASWGGNWVEYHNPNGTSVLASDNFSNLKRGTWSSDACLEVCYAYPDGGGWCPQWQEVEGGWVNLQPETGEVVHYIYLFQPGDPLNLEQLMERHDAQANRI